MNEKEKANIRAKKWFVENKARRYAYAKEWSDKNRPKISIYQKTYKLKLRRNVIGYYSRYTYKCVCCLDAHLEFLTIDHINGDGSKHRKEIGSRGGHGFYTWLKKNNYPQGYRVLCMNCNHSLGVWGYCPHYGKPEPVVAPL